MKLRTLCFVCMLSPVVVACSGNDNDDATPAVTVAAAECQAKDVVMNPTVGIEGMAFRWHVTVSVNVTCNGAPVEGAELTVQYPWLFPFTVVTDAQGDASATRDATTSPQPTGSIDLTLQMAGEAVTRSVAF
ncbi:MAG: hypothetical protein R3F42_08750 [Pseudomonadota bacterium]